MIGLNHTGVLVCCESRGAGREHIHLFYRLVSCLSCSISQESNIQILDSDLGFFFLLLHILNRFSFHLDCAFGPDAPLVKYHLKNDEHSLCRTGALSNQTSTIYTTQRSDGVGVG